MVRETHKILGDPNLRVNATCVRVPVLRAHSEALNIEFTRDVSPEQAVEMWLASPGHRKVLLSSAWTHIGLSAVHVRSAPGVFEGYDVTIMTADFGSRS